MDAAVAAAKLHMSLLRGAVQQEAPYLQQQQLLHRTAAGFIERLQARIDAHPGAEWAALAHTKMAALRNVHAQCATMLQAMALLDKQQLLCIDNAEGEIQAAQLKTEALMRKNETLEREIEAAARERRLHPQTADGEQSEEPGALHATVDEHDEDCESCGQEGGEMGGDAADLPASTAVSGEPTASNFSHGATSTQAGHNDREHRDAIPQRASTLDERGSASEQSPIDAVLRVKAEFQRFSTSVEHFNATNQLFGVAKQQFAALMTEIHAIVPQRASAAEAAST
jgi:hypothetical protein